MTVLSVWDSRRNRIVTAHVALSDRTPGTPTRCPRNGQTPRGTFPSCEADRFMRLVPHIRLKELIWACRKSHRLPSHMMGILDSLASPMRVHVGDGDVMHCP